MSLDSFSATKVFLKKYLDCFDDIASLFQKLSLVKIFDSIQNSSLNIWTRKTFAPSDNFFLPQICNFIIKKISNFKRLNNFPDMFSSITHTLIY